MHVINICGTVQHWMMRSVNSSFIAHIWKSLKITVGFNNISLQNIHKNSIRDARTPQPREIFSTP